MAQSLIIVESPTKIKTIKKFLGPDCEIMATKGHIKDLPKSKLSIDIEHDFTPTYHVIEGRKKIIDEIRRAAKNAPPSFSPRTPIVKERPLPGMSPRRSREKGNTFTACSSMTSRGVPSWTAWPTPWSWT